MQGLRDLRVVDFSNRIAGAYATKLLADAYAEVIKVEPPDGDALRRWTASDQDLDGKDGALFQFLNTSKKSVVGAIGDDHVDALLRGADLVIETSDGAIDGKALTEQYPGLTVLSISDYGLDGPLTGTPSAITSTTAPMDEPALRMPSRYSSQTGTMAASGQKNGF